MNNLEFEDFNDVVNKINLKVLEHGHLQTGKEWCFTNLCSPFNRLYFIISGSAKVKTENTNFVMEQGNMYLIPLNNTANYICEESMEKFYVHFRLELIPGQDLFESCRYCDSNPFEMNVVQNLVKRASSGSINDLVYCKGLLLSFISSFLKQHSQRISEQIKISSKYTDIYNFIISHCYADLRVMDIAERFYIPSVNLSKNFKNDTGFTLKSFIDGKIVQKAQEMLLVTQMPVKEVALELRFTDEFHFSRFFKKHTGISPSLYRLRQNTHK